MSLENYNELEAAQVMWECIINFNDSFLIIKKESLLMLGNPYLPGFFNILKTYDDFDLKRELCYLFFCTGLFDGDNEELLDYIASDLS